MGKDKRIISFLKKSNTKETKYQKGKLAYKTFKWMLQAKNHQNIFKNF